MLAEGCMKCVSSFSSYAQALCCPANIQYQIATSFQQAACCAVQSAKESIESLPTRVQPCESAFLPYQSHAACTHPSIMWRSQPYTLSSCHAAAVQLSIVTQLCKMPCCPTSMHGSPVHPVPCCAINYTHDQAAMLHATARTTAVQPWKGMQLVVQSAHILAIADTLDTYQYPMNGGWQKSYCAGVPLGRSNENDV